MLHTSFRHLRSIAMAVVLSAAFLAGSSSALAGTAEIKALQAKIAPPGTALSAANTTQLYNAFAAVLADPAFAKLKPGVVAGEALKAAGPTAVNAGEFFAAQILANQPALVTDRQNFVALAATTAGAGKGINVFQIADLASELLSAVADKADAFFIATATLSKSKPGQGAILGGRAEQIFEDSAQPAVDALALANKSLIDSTTGKATKIAGAVQDIAQWIGAEFAEHSADSAAFAVQFADGNPVPGKPAANIKSYLKIVTGVSAGDPTNAGNIVHNLYNQKLLASNGTLNNPAVAPTGGENTGPNAGQYNAKGTLFNTAVAGAANVAKAVATVASSEEIAKIGNAVGQLIGTTNPVKTTVGLVTLSKAASTVKTLATILMAKPESNAFGQIIVANTKANKKDEMAEVSAYMLGGLLASPELVLNADPKKAAAQATKIAGTFLSIITSVTTVKPKVVKGIAGGPTPDEVNGFATDTALSVAYTVLHSGLDARILAAFQSLMLGEDKNGTDSAKTAAKINKTQSGDILARLQALYASPLAVHPEFEDGTVIAGAVSDPETDIHPFS